MVTIAEGFNELLFTPLLWVGLLVGGFLTIWAFLYLNRRRKLQYKVYELVRLGEGKTFIKETRAGWFKNKRLLFGLIDYGNETIMYTKDWRRVLNFSTEDYHENAKGRCLIVTSDPEDKSIVVPINSVEFRGDSIYSQIAPMEIRDASIDAFKRSEKELKSFSETIVQLVVIGILIMGSIIAIALVIRFAQGTINDVTALTKENADMCVRAMENAIQTVLSQNSNAP